MKTMRLHYQTHSPYARKVLVFAHEAMIADRLDVLHQETSPTARNDEVFSLNPLGKVPVLETEDAGALFDSDVICRYLEDLNGADPLIPRSGTARWQALEMQAVAQGICEAGIAVRWETVRRPPALRFPPLRDGYVQKLKTSYDWLDRALIDTTPITVGHIAVATALDWIEFRKLETFRGHRRLSEWFDNFRSRQSMQATPLSGDTVD